MLRHVALATTDFSEERSPSIIRVTRIGELITTLAVRPTRKRRSKWPGHYGLDASGILRRPMARFWSLAWHFSFQQERKYLINLASLYSTPHTVLHRVVLVLVSWGWDETEAMWHVATTWSTLPGPAYVQCLVVGRMISKGSRSARRNCPDFCFVHHKSHMIWTGIELDPQRREAGF
jgi:hypothetical protein